nr:hypothetical protein [Tanacetum cinerariifolium]
MVAYLSKSDASKGFNQILDFLNGSSIKYALTVNPNIYVSCIKQFWNTVVVKQVNDVTRLQALVDKKKVVVTEAVIRECMSAKRISWNEFNSSMASAVICLSTGKGFSGVKTPLFEGLLVDQEVDKEGDAKGHVEKVNAGDATQRDDITAASDPVTAASTIIAAAAQVPAATLTAAPVQPPSPPPLPQLQQAADFPMSLLQEALNACAALTRRAEHLEYDKVAQALEITKLKRRVKKLKKGNKFKVLKLRRLQKGRMIAEMDKDDVVVLMDDKEEDKHVEETKVVEITAASAIIPTAEPQVPAATHSTAPVRVAAAPRRRRKGVVIRDPEEESTTSTVIPETKSKDKGKGILVEEPKPLKKKKQIKMDEEYARKLHAQLNKDID